MSNVVEKEELGFDPNKCILPTIKIDEDEIIIREYLGRRVITFDAINRLHGDKKNAAQMNFSRNKQHFIENEDYFYFEGQNGREALQIGGYNNMLELNSNNNFNFYLFTETGYLMLVKSLRGDLAWRVQRMLVNNYFAKRSGMVTPDIASALRLIADAFEEQSKALNEAQSKIEEQQVKIDATANRLQKIDEMYDVEIDPTWIPATKLAERLKLYSEKNHPHASLAMSIAVKAGINVRRSVQRKTEDVHVVAKREGETVIFDLFFSPIAVEKIKDWWTSNEKEAKFTELYLRARGHSQAGDIRKMGYRIGERKYYIRFK